MVYRNLKGSYLLAFGSLVVSFIRALELPALGLSYLCAFEALQVCFWNISFFPLFSIHLCLDEQGHLRGLCHLCISGFSWLWNGNMVLAVLIGKKKSTFYVYSSFFVV